MGMFDKEPNFGETFKEGDRFVILAAEYVGEIRTQHGKAEKSVFTIVSRDHPDRKIRYSVLGTGFAGQARRAEASDFPMVAEFVTVPTGNDGNRVKLLAKVDVTPRAFIDGEDGPAIEPLEPTTAPAAGDEAIPF
jgi:hypothetical protein